MKFLVNVKHDGTFYKKGDDVPKNLEAKMLSLGYAAKATDEKEKADDADAKAKKAEEKAAAKAKADAEKAAAKAASDEEKKTQDAAPTETQAE